MTSLKKLVLVLFISLLLVCIVMWGIVKSLKPDTVKAYINTQIEQLTAQSGKIDGEISWHIFPRPRIKITHIQIGDLKSTSPFAMTIDNLFLNLKMTQLLRGNLVFSELNIDGFTVHMDNSARANTLPPQEKPIQSTEPLASQFSIKSLMLSHGKLVWTNEQTQILLSGLQIGVEQFNLRQQPFPFQLKSKVLISKVGQSIAHTQLLFKGNTRLEPRMLHRVRFNSLPLFGQLTLLDSNFQQFKIDRMQANTSLKEGVLNLNPLTLSLYRGESVGDLRYEPAKDLLAINQTATNLDSSKLIADVVAKKLMKGRLDFSLHTEIDLRLFTWPQSMKAKGNITVKDGTLMGINLNKMITATNERINDFFINKTTNNPPSPPQELLADPAFFKGNTDFKLMASQYHIDQGLLHSNLFVLQTGRLQLKGDGQINLFDYAMTGNLLAKVVFTNDQANKIQQLLGGAIPLLVKGTLMQPLILPDLKKISPLLTQTWIKETLAMPVKEMHKQLKVLLH